MLELAALKHIRPFVALPSLGGGIRTVCARSLLGLANLAWTHGFAMQTRFLDGDSLITRARNRLVAEFMADPRWTHLFWIDTDIGFEPDAALRLLLSGRDVVAGAYPLKRDGWPVDGLAQALPASSTRADFDALHARFPINPLTPPGVPDADGFLPVAHAPTGFMLIARRVFERMARAYPELRYTPDGVAGANDVERSWPHYRFFDTLAEPGNGRYLSEDFAFCERWRALGGDIAVDLRSTLLHEGSHVYSGQLGNALRVQGQR